MVMNWVYKAGDRDIINACKFVKLVNKEIY